MGLLGLNLPYMFRRLLSVFLSASIVLTAPGALAWAAPGDEVGVTYDDKSGTVRVSTSKDVHPISADSSQVEDVLRKLNDPALLSRTSPDQVAQMRTFLKKYKDDLEKSGTDERDRKSVV